MRPVSILFNLALSLFTLLVLITDGLPREAHFIAFSFLLLLVPVLTAVVIQRFGGPRQARGPYLGWGTALCNVVLLAASSSAVVTQYPSHPPEAGLLPFTLLALFVPLLSLFVLSRYLRRPSEHRTFAR
jgi:hypothetical protein